MTKFGESLNEHADRGLRLDEALARTQAEERAEREQAIVRQQETDERMVRMLAQRV